MNKENEKINEFNEALTLEEKIITAAMNLYLIKSKKSEDKKENN